MILATRARLEKGTHSVTDAVSQDTFKKEILVMSQQWEPSALWRGILQKPIDLASEHPAVLVIQGCLNFVFSQGMSCGAKSECHLVRGKLLPGEGCTGRCKHLVQRPLGCQAELLGLPVHVLCH